MFKKFTAGAAAVMLLAGGFTLATPNSASAGVRIFIGIPHAGFFIGKPKRCWRHRHWPSGKLKRHCGKKGGHRHHH